MQTQGLTRRDLLETSLLSAAAAAAANGTGLLTDEAAALADEANRPVGPNDRVRMAVIGVRGQGGQHTAELLKNKGVELVAICDVDPASYAKHTPKFAEQRKNNPNFRDPAYVSDIRKLLEDKTIDAVTIATPNHWHALAAIWAIQAGKDVYVEKPVSHNVSEGRRIVEFARKHGRIVQTGTQSRSMIGMRKTIEYVQSGKLGKVTFARGLCFKSRKSLGQATGPCTLPKGIDFDMWAGPAPKVVPVRAHLHYDWHWFWDTGNGDLGNQGIHEMDKARWGLGKTTLPAKVFSYGGRLGYVDDGQTANTQVCAFDWGDAQLVFEVRGLETQPFQGAKIGNIWYGSEGIVVSTSYSSGTAFDLKGQAIESWKGGSYQDHFVNFLKAVRSRKVADLNADIEEGHLSSAMCHLGNISYRLGQETSFGATPSLAAASNDGAATFERFTEHLRDNGLKLDTLNYRMGRELAIDPATEKTGQPEVDVHFTREYRDGYVVPASV